MSRRPEPGLSNDERMSEPAVNDATACQIIAATVDDVPLILRFIRELAEYEKRLEEVVAGEDDLRASLFAEPPQAEVIIARVNGDAAGFALYFHNYSTFLGRRGIWLEDLYVRPQWRGRGIGRRLLGRLAQIAVERRCGRLEWWVLDWNADAIGFYRRLGAAPMSEWTVQRLTGEALKRLAGEH